MQGRSRPLRANFALEPTKRLDRVSREGEEIGVGRFIIEPVVSHESSMNERFAAPVVVLFSKIINSVQSPQDREGLLLSW